MRRAAVVSFLCAVVLAPTLENPVRGASPSFDCSRAAAPIERLICSSDPLSTLDAALGVAFRDHRERLDEAARTAALRDQRHWLQTRLTECNIPAQGDIPAERRAAAERCVSDLYAARIAALKTVPQAAPATVAASPAGAAPPPAGGVVKLDRTLFPAKDRNEVIATIREFGRYAISARSDQGTAVQLIDRMAGPGAVDGSAGHSDGRVDAFLDRGQYKVRLISDPRGSGDAELSVTPFTELNPDPQQLVELKPIAAELGDHEQRSYWLDIRERRFVAIEAAGRYLTDLRLWRDGNWLVDAVPTTGERDPSGGEPLATRQLALWLEPGLYRLTAYGGAGMKWSSGGTSKPLYLRYGVPTLPDSDRAVHEASPVGLDRWIVPGSATYFRIDIDNAEHTALSVAPYDPEHPYATGGDRAAIEKDSRDPKAEIRTGILPAEKSWLVTVERKPGARYRLQFFNDTRERALDFSGYSADYWLASLEAGNVNDSLDPTAIVVQGGKEIVAASAVEIDPAKGWRRKFNLINTVTLFLRADQATELVTEGTGADAEYRIEPFLVSRPIDYRTPPSKVSGGTWTIDRGYSVLTISPREGGKGVLDLTLRGPKMSGGVEEQPRLAAPVFPKLSLDRGQFYMLYLSATGESFGGATAQKLPLDLARGASFQLAGGARLATQVIFATDGKLEAETENGKGLPLSIDGQPAASGPRVTSGRHELAITAPAGDPVFVALRFTPAAQLQATPLPPVDPARLAERPNFPVLSAGKPQFLDLARNQQATFAVAVDKPALYRLESSGIVETEGALRTRIVTELDKQTANGIGRNFLIQQYLREGDYQLTARPSGQSFGPIGVSVNATPVAELGMIEPEVWERTTLSPGQAGRYRFHIVEAGDYRLHTLGLGHAFTMRLDDGDGWPLLTPGGEADSTLRLEPGDYQMVLLPQPVESRAVTLLHRIAPPAELSGHGPFALALGETAHNRWMEPEKGAPRTPDRWNFALPAEAEITITIDSGMQATLVQDGKPTDKVALSERPWVGTLPAGNYALDVVSAAPDSRVDYAVGVASGELLAGQTRPVTAPARLKVSIGEDRQVEFASFGDQDVKAALYDSGGRPVAANDDRDNDWNFLIATRLQPGRYELQIDPVGAEKADTEVSLDQPEEVRDGPLAFGKLATIADGKVHVLPLPEAEKGKAMVLTAHAGVPVGLAVEAGEGSAWRTLGSAAGINPFLALPNATGLQLRARAWTIDHEHLPVEIAATSLASAAASEDALTGRGVTLTPLDGPASGLAAAEVTLKQPGLLQLTGGAETLLWARDEHEVAIHDGAGSIVAPSTALFLIDRTNGATGASVTARRIDLQGKDAVHMVLHGAERIELPISAVAAGGETVLWQVDGQGGQPGIAIGDSTARPDGAPALMAVGAESPTSGSAVAVAPGPIGKPVLRLWNAGSDAASEIALTLRRTALHVPKAEPATLGISDSAFAGTEARLLTLPAGLKRLILVLPQGTVAVPRLAETAEQMVWAVSPKAVTIETAADQLLLLHPGSDKAPYSLTIEPVDGKTPLVLSAGGSISRFSPTPGLLRIRLAPSTSGLSSLRVAGSATAASLMTTSGTVRRGGQIAKISEGGLVDIAHDAGLFAVSLDGSKKLNRAEPSTRIDTRNPTDIPLAGREATMAINAGPARLVHLNSDSPILLRAYSDAEPSEPALFAAGADMDFMAPEGKGLSISIAPAGVPTLSGTLHLASIDLTPIGEGLGPKRRLAPGQSRAFSFILPEARTVGVGVRASVDIADSRLLAADGAEIGRGLVHMHDLKAGTYVLVVSAPSDGPAIDIEPALVGTELPDRGPPDDVKATYLALIGKQSKK